MTENKSESYSLAEQADLATAVVRRAASLAARMRADGLETEFKTSISDVVTEADRTAEKLVVESLSSLRPQDGILGEEGSAKYSESGLTWVIDPVDGTYNFTTGSDYWCSAIALVEGDPEKPERVILGAVSRPATGETWVGGPDLPTTRVEADGTRTELTIHDATLNTVCAGTYLHSTAIDPDSHTPEDIDCARRWADATSRFATWRVMGSASIDLAGVADGRLGAWFQRDVAPWDWLPGYALVCGAGGVGTLAGRWRVAGSQSSVAELASILGDSPTVD
ncbi:inositol monophosphatase [Corynebacterium sp. H113]|uniref:inositol monophosphatase family protein n=1 Tax=unclassified Corynebacterium TaxID=2624378 RepID=UPI0030A9510D